MSLFVKCFKPKVIFQWERKLCLRKCRRTLILGTTLVFAVWVIVLGGYWKFTSTEAQLVLWMGTPFQIKQAIPSNKRTDSYMYGKDIKNVIQKYPYSNQTRTMQPASRDFDTGVSPTRLSNIQPGSKKLAVSHEYKSLLVYGRYSEIGDGSTIFSSRNCPEQRCRLSGNSNILFTKEAAFYDAVVFTSFITRNIALLPKYSVKQVWVLFLLESPLYSPDLRLLDSMINWTFTYRRDSTVVTPYGQFVGNASSYNTDTLPIKNFAAGKSKLVAWFVSNCGSKNGRFKYVLGLQKHVTVDVYGICGPLKCDRQRDEGCLRMLQSTYKFYLSFENSNCNDYITEKFWKILNYDVVPVVMGASKRDYEAVAPPNSFIHVDDFSSPAHLAAYLKFLDHNDTAYNQYFKWKQSGDFHSQSMWCKLCERLHDDAALSKPTWYESVDSWWRPPGVCAKTDWADFELGIDFVANNLGH